MEDLTDNETEELLRRWWSDNWLWLVGGLVIGLGALAGYQYWQKSKLASAERDAASYISVIEALSKDQPDAAAATAKALRDLHATSPYADQADLALAASAVERHALEDAAKHLKAVADGSRDKQLRQIAKTRLARVLIEEGKYDEALGVLDVASAGAFGSLYHDIRGDALAGKGDTAAARREYESALAAAATQPGIEKAYVELKRDALPVSAPAAAAPTTTPAVVPATGGAK